MYLKFPSILAGDGSLTSYLVLAGIILIVVAILTFVFRRMADE
ncbi:MAG: LPXTG cell wall anchor domain-containing protein [Bacteroidota bacterium]